MQEHYQARRLYADTAALHGWPELRAAKNFSCNTSRQKVKFNQRSGSVPERLKGMGCKPIGVSLRWFESNPAQYAARLAFWSECLSRASLVSWDSGCSCENSIEYRARPPVCSVRTPCRAWRSERLAGYLWRVYGCRKMPDWAMLRFFGKTFTMTGAYRCEAPGVCGVAPVF